MLLTGFHALPQPLQDESSHDAPWDVWVTAAQLRDGVLPVPRFVAGPGDEPTATLQCGDRRYRLHLLPAGDAREQFVDVNSDSPLLDNAEGWTLRIATPASVALIMRASLYEVPGWHRRIRQYHALAARLRPSDYKAAERLAYDGLRAQLLRRLDAQSGIDFNMRVSNEDFFNDFKYPWLRVHAHDELHRATCYGDVPMYQMLKDDPSQAYIPRHGFQQLSHDERIRLVREECYALALERVLIPAQDLGVPWTEEQGFQHALRRVCTNLARGWFRDFAIDNYPEVSRYDKSFLGEYQCAVAQGKLRRKQLAISTQDRRHWLAQYLDQQRDKDRLAGLEHAMLHRVH